MGKIVQLAETIEGVYYDVQDRISSAKYKLDKKIEQKKNDAKNAKIAPTCTACGKKAIVDPEGNGYWRCPTEYGSKGAEPFTKHELMIQHTRKSRPDFCIVVKEEGGFRPQFDAYDRSPEVFPTELEAWREMDAVYWGQKEWPEEEETN